MQVEKELIPLELVVNGEKRQLDAKPTYTLLEVLRDGLGLTGAKRGCDDGTCGTCTVIVDGSMRRACRLSIDQSQGKEVQTIEGVGDRDNLDPLQDAFVQNDAVQCGFCTPGMIMAAKSLLKRNPDPTRDEIGKALGSNLCRCTGYISILDSISSVINGNGHTNGDGPTQSVAERADALDKVLGKALYAADLTMTGMVHAAVVRSPHSHAEIVGIDDSAARALPGVVAVVTAKDVPGLNRFGRAKKDQPVLVDDKVRQIGDPVVAIAAETPEIAAEAAALVNVEYKLLPAVLRPEDAMVEGAPIVHGDTNMLSDKTIEWGDASKGMAEADVIVEETYTTPWAEHAYMEPEATLGYFQEDILVLRTATQHSFLHQKTIAETMDVPEDKVRIVPTIIGGAFGGKTDLSCQCIVALLTLKTQRPVKIVYTRKSPSPRRRNDTRFGFTAAPA